MQRCEIGRYESARAGGEQVRAFVPLPLPILSLPQVCTHTELSFPTAASAMQTLAEQGIARELTGRPRNRLFAYDRYLSILAEGTETP